MNYNNQRKLKFIYVSIDYQKLTHTFCVINYFNEKLDMYTFKNNVNDFRKLLNIVNKYTDEKISSVFGLEDTKHLGHTLVHFYLIMVTRLHILFGMSLYMHW